MCDAKPVYHFLPNGHPDAAIPFPDFQQFDTQPLAERILL
jgi:hypothetical protein